MKVVLLLLLLAGLAHCQFHNFGGFVKPNTSQRTKDPNVHQVDGNSQYHFSWLVNPGRVFKGHEAANYCSRLGDGWAAVAISSQQENNFIGRIFDQYRGRLEYIWTGGVRQGNGFAWSNGESFRNFNDWSHTGGTPTRRRQPDNREGNENCLAVLQNIYRDGLKWHDVGCGHKKPVMCEKH